MTFKRVVLGVSVAVLALTPAAAAGAKKTKPSCRAGKEAKGCKLPSGAFYTGRGDGRPLDVQIGPSRFLVSTDLTAPGPCAGDVTVPRIQVSIKQRPRVGKTYKIAYSVHRYSRISTFNGTVTFSAKRATFDAVATSTIEDPGSPVCSVPFKLAIKRGS